MTFVVKDQTIYSERDPFNFKDAGSDEINYFLKGLQFKVSVKVTGTVLNAYLYSSGEPENEDNRFDLTDEGEGIYSYEAIAGQGATALEYGEGNWADGVKFYFRIKIEGVNGDLYFNKVFWIRDAANIIRFQEGLSYNSPYPVMIDSLTINVSIGANAKNPAGVVKYGGIETVEIFTTPTAPSPGSHVNQVTETSIEELTTLTLPDRTYAGGIPNYITPPGCPDFSMFFHYLTFRLRAKTGSSVYRDIPVILFACRKCKNGEYGYDSTGEVLPPPEIPLIILLPPTKEGPPPTCSSRAIVPAQAGNGFNVYAGQIYARIYRNLGDAIPLIEDFVVPWENVQPQQAIIQRADAGGDLNLPVAGWLMMFEKNPARESNYQEITLYGCTREPVKEPTPRQQGGKLIIEETGGGGEFIPGEVYKIKIYDEKYGETPERIYDAEYLSETIIITILPIEEEFDGWFDVIENGIPINSPREEIDFKEPVTMDDVVNNGDNTVNASITVGSRNLISGATFQVRRYTNADDTTPAETFSATYVNSKTVSFGPITATKVGHWAIVENGVEISDRKSKTVAAIVAIDSIEAGGDETVEITLPVGSRPFDPEGSFEIILYPDAISETPIRTIPATYIDSDTIEFNLEFIEYGWWAIEENGVDITPSRFEKEIRPCGECKSYSKMQEGGDPPPLPITLNVHSSTYPCSWRNPSGTLRIQYGAPFAGQWAMVDSSGSPSGWYGGPSGRSNPQGTYYYHSGVKNYGDSFSSGACNNSP